MRRLAVLLLAGISIGVAAPIAAQPLQAGAATLDITPPKGVPLAGYSERRLKAFGLFSWHRYASYFKPSEGTEDPIQARVLYLQKGSQRLIFVSLDMIGADRRMRADLLKRLASRGIGDEALFVSATHTHSGPGSFARSWVWEIVAADNYLHPIYRRLVDGVFDAIVQAEGRLEEASLVAYSFTAVDLQRNRRNQPGHFDPTANVMLVRAASDGAWMAGLANLAIHGTALDASNLLYSADVAGRMMRDFENQLQAVNPGPALRRPTVLFINGAEGDVAPLLDHVPGMDEIGSRFALQALTALGTATPVSPDWTVRSTDVPLGRARFNFKPCMKGFGRWFAELPNLFVAGAFPRTTRVWVVKLGAHAFFTWPGEATTDLGLDVRAAGTAAGVGTSWFMGLTNDHLSYFVTPAAYSQTCANADDCYESCSSLYGARGGAKIVDAYKRLLVP